MIDAYLERLHYTGSRTPTLETLRQLHYAHMLHIPFENLDIPLKRPILIDEQAHLDKILKQGRGGFCYELNGAFAALLRALGYEVTLLSMQVNGKNGFGPELDHMAVLVNLDEPYLADVGFGASFLFPLRLVPEIEQVDASGAYRLVVEGDHWMMQLKDQEGKWNPEYLFTLTPRQPADFAAMCHYQQTSTETGFTKKAICSRATPEGRISLSNQMLIITKHGQREEIELPDIEAVHAALAEHFGIMLPARLEQFALYSA